jgi:hypothetical protein
MSAMLPTHSCHHCAQFAIECDGNSEAKSRIRQWEDVNAAADSGCPFFQNRLRDFEAARHDQGCAQGQLFMHLEMESDDAGISGLLGFKCSWECQCGALTSEWPEKELMAFEVTDGDHVRLLLNLRFKRDTDKQYSPRNIQFDHARHQSP